MRPLADGGAPPLFRGRLLLAPRGGGRGGRPGPARGPQSSSPAPPAFRARRSLQEFVGSTLAPPRGRWLAPGSGVRSDPGPGGSRTA